MVQERARRHARRSPSGSTGGRYIDVDIDRDAAARYGLNIADVQSVDRRPRSAARTSARRSKACSAFRSTCAIRASCAIRVERSARSCRSSPSAARRSRWATSRRSAIADGPPMLRSENARLSGWVYVDLRGRDLRSAVDDMQRAVARAGRRCRPAIRIAWSGQFEYLERATRAAAARRAGHAADHLRAAVSDVPALRRGAAHHGDAAVRAGRRLLADLSAGPRRLGRDGGRLHRAGGRRGRVRRRDAALPEARLGIAPRGRRAASTTRRCWRRDPRRRGAARAAEGDDGRA